MCLLPTSHPAVTSQSAAHMLKALRDQAAVRNNLKMKAWVYPSRSIGDVDIHMLSPAGSHLAVVSDEFGDCQVRIFTTLHLSDE